MHTEYEVRVLEINKDELIKKIESLGGKHEGDFFQKRYVYDFNPVRPKKWIRLRTDGIKTTLTIKDVRSSKIDGTKELEIVVSDFDNTNNILNELGYISKSFQENKRTRYVLNDIELDIDQWPMIPCYLEIEGKNEEDINAMIDLLEIDKSKVTAKDVQSVYLDFYGIDLTKMDELKF